MHRATRPTTSSLHQEDTITTTTTTPAPDTPAYDLHLVHAAVSAATAADAQAVQDLIADALGGPHKRPVGDRPNNHGLMAASGSYDLKLIELVTNMQDGVLERHALRRWKTPDQVPYTTPHEAAAALLTDATEVGEHPVTVEFRESDPPTTSTKRLTATFRDLGCGLRPSDLPSTVFQLGSSFKEDRLYLQGAFGLGGAMTYRNAAAVVVVSRRDPALLDAGEDDVITAAVVQWDVLTKGRSAFYLVDRPWSRPGDVAMPWSCPASHVPDFEPGTQLSLISYGVDGLHRAREGDVKSFDTVVNTRLFRPVTPIRFTNRTTDRNRSTNMRGLAKRLADNPNADRVDGQETLPFNLDGVTYHLPVGYWVFPEEVGSRKSFVAHNHVVLFLSHGQVHHHWDGQTFKAKTKLNKIADRVLITIDTDELPIQLRTSLFTADRNDLVRNDAALRLEETVRSFLAEACDPLRELNNKLIREALKGSSSKSTVELSRRISRALALRLGFGAGGAGTGGGQPGGGRAGGGGSGGRREVELHDDPTTIAGPATVRAEIGRTRSVPFTVDVKDEFFSAGRGMLAFEFAHDGIGEREVAISQVRKGRFHVTIAVPDGLEPATTELTLHLTDWFRASGGLGDPIVFTCRLELVDHIPASGSGTGKSTGGGQGEQGSSLGDNIVMVWTDHEREETWSKTTVGVVEDVRACDVAETVEGYSDLAVLGEQTIPVVKINEEYPPFKAYLAARSKSLSSLDRPREEYGLGVSVDLLVMHEARARREKKGEPDFDPALLQASSEAAAKAILAVMPAFDELAKAAGMGGDP